MLFCLMPMTATSEPPIALLPTLIRWWEWPKALLSQSGKGRHAVTWDACSQQIGGAEGAGWEALLQMETMDPKERQNFMGTSC